jgi:hypothetical protein
MRLHLKENLQTLVKELLHITAAAVVSVSCVHEVAESQDTAAVGRQLLRAYIDCGQCDEDYLRQQIGFVNLVRDPRLADVTVQVTSLPNSSGGRTYSIEVIGTRRQVRSADTLLVDISVTTPDIEGRDMLVRAVKVALVPFLHGSEAIPHLDVTYRPPAAATTVSATRGARDRWNGWVFKVGGQGLIEGDDNYSTRGGDWSTSANRITEAFKVSISARGEFRRSRFKLSDSSTLVSHSRMWTGRALAVQSLGDHFSLGMLAESGSSVFENTRGYLRVGPVLEYDIYPYREATQRQIMVRYSVASRSNRYVDTTIFGKLSEARPHHELSLSPNIMRPWGSIWGSTVWSQYLDDPTKRRLTTNLGIDFRITAGLTVNFYGAYSYIRDQLNIPGIDLTDEQRLLRLRELQSGSYFFTALGLSYTFGSVFSNVVNPRLRL